MREKSKTGKKKQQGESDNQEKTKKVRSNEKVFNQYALQTDG